MVTNEGHNLGFILSSPRSGSSLLSAILDGHRSVHVPNEPWLLLALSTLYPKPNTNPYSTYRHDQHQAIKAMSQFLTQEQFYTASRNFATTAYNSVLKDNNKTILIDKTPRYYHETTMLKALFPEAKKIWLKRNPLDVAASYLSTWKITPDQLTGDPLLPCSYDLTFGFKWLADFADSTSNIIEIKYEDLVTNSNKIIQEVCEHMGVDYDESLLDYKQSKSIVSNTLLTMGDKKLLKHSRPHSNSVHGWEKILNRDQVQHLINYIGEDIFVRMGYQNTVSHLKSIGYQFPSQEELGNSHNLIFKKEITINSYLKNYENSPLGFLDGLSGPNANCESGFKSNAMALICYYENRLREHKKIKYPWYFYLRAWQYRRNRNQLRRMFQERL